MKSITSLLLIVATLSSTSFAHNIGNRNCLADVIESTPNIIVHQPLLLNKRADAGSKYSYEGSTGPEEWGKFNQVCAAGEYQSPVNFQGESLTVSGKPSVERWPSVEFKAVDANGTGIEIANLDGLTVQVQFKKAGWDASTTQIDGNNYTLLQMHMHSPSEHHVEGRYYPLEAHFVHASAEGKLSVLGVFFEIGESSVDFVKEIVKN
ncbi:hypothetical protein HDV05_000696, partial [Chytridiales sp. JEL 0842]